MLGRGVCCGAAGPGDTDAVCSCSLVLFGAPLYSGVRVAGHACGVRPGAGPFFALWRTMMYIHKLIHKAYALYGLYLIGHDIFQTTWLNYL